MKTNLSYKPRDFWDDTKIVLSKFQLLSNFPCEEIWNPCASKIIEKQQNFKKHMWELIN